MPTHTVKLQTRTIYSHAHTYSKTLDKNNLFTILPTHTVKLQTRTIYSHAYTYSKTLDKNNLFIIHAPKYL